MLLMKKTGRYIVGVHRSVSTYQLPTPWSRSFAIAWLGDHQPPKPKGGRLVTAPVDSTVMSLQGISTVTVNHHIISFVPQSSAWTFIAFIANLEESKSSKVQSNFDSEAHEIILFRNPSLWTTGMKVSGLADDIAHDQVQSRCFPPMSTGNNHPWKRVDANSKQPSDVWRLIRTKYEV